MNDTGLFWDGQRFSVDNGERWVPGQSLKIDRLLDGVGEPEAEPDCEPDLFWSESRLSDLRMVFDAGRNRAADGSLAIDVESVLDHFVQNSPDDEETLRLRVGAGVVFAAGYGIAPRWSGLLRLGRRKRVALPEGLRQLIFERDYVFFDLIWLSRDEPDLDWQLMRDEADRRIAAKEKKGQFGKLPDVLDAFGCLRLRARALRAIEAPAVRRCGPDEDRLLALYPSKSRSKGKLARENSLLIYAMRLLEIEVAGLSWDAVKRQVLTLGSTRTEAWGKVAEVYSWIAGKRIKPESLETRTRKLVQMIVQDDRPRLDGLGGSSSKMIVQDDRPRLDDHCSRGRVVAGSGSCSITGWNDYIVSSNSSVFVGVDPGKHGAIAIACDGLLVTWAMPDEDEAPLLLTIAQLAAQSNARVYVEHVNPWNGMNSQAAFSFGRSAERAELPFRMMGLNVELVTPPSWQSLVGVTGPDDQRQRAERLSQLLTERFDVLEPDLGAFSDGEIDAGLIAVSAALAGAERRRCKFFSAGSPLTSKVATG